MTTPYSRAIERSKGDQQAMVCMAVVILGQSSFLIVAKHHPMDDLSWWLMAGFTAFMCGLGWMLAMLPRWRQRKMDYDVLNFNDGGYVDER